MCGYMEGQLQGEHSQHHDIEIRLFGTPTITVCGSPLAPLHSRRGLWVVALLALRGGTGIRRSKLAGMVWPDSDDTTALHNLRQTLANLRRLLGPMADCVLAQADHSLRLDTRKAFVDVLAFDDGTAQGSFDALEQSVSLYTGPLLESCDEPWALEEREPRALAYIESLERLADMCEAAGDSAGASNWLRRAEAADHYRESVRRSLMRALAAGGELSAATEVYRDLRHRLHVDLNADPDPATTELYHAIRSGTVARKANPQVSSPAPIGKGCAKLPFLASELIGRGDDIRAVTTHILTSRLVTLTGSGGVGKTSLAISVARHTQWQPDIVECVAFASLADITDAETVPANILKAIGGNEGDGTLPSVEALRNAVADRKLLLVLDNCEHLADTCASLITHLLVNCPFLRILATSRHALKVPGEVLWRVPSLQVPPHSVRRTIYSATDSVAPVESFSAVRLFIERARAADPTIEISLETGSTIAEICRLLDGIPLAIELAAVRVRSLDIDAIYTRLRDGMRLVSGTGAASRHQTLDKVFEWSWSLLDAAEQMLLRRLSVFTGGFTLVAAELVGSGPDLDAREIVDVLAALIDKSLVIYTRNQDSNHNVNTSVCGSRYHLLQTVRQLALEKLHEASESERLQARHLDYFLTWAEEVKTRLWDTDQAQWFEAMERDHDNIRSALAWSASLQHGIVDQYRMVLAASRFWDTYGHLREGSRHLEQALTRCTNDVPDTLRAKVLTSAGWAAAKLGDPGRARGHYDLACALYRQAGDHNSLSFMLSIYSAVAVKEGDVAGARSLLEEARAIYKEIGTEVPWAVLNNLGDIEVRCSNYDAARAYFEQSLGAIDLDNDHQPAGITLSNLGELAWRSGQTDTARMHFEAAIRAWHAGGALVDVPIAIEMLAYVAIQANDAPRAATLLGAAEALRGDLGVSIQFVSELEVSSATAQRAMGREAYDCALAAGLSMDMEAAIAYALGKPEA